MTTREIEALLARYFEGETTLQEEKQLIELMLGPDVPENLKVHQPIFRYMEQSMREALPEPDFLGKFETIISPEEGETKIIPLYKSRNYFVFFSSIAAGVLLVIGLLFTFINDYSGKNQTNKNNHNSEIAYLQTQDVLMFVSGNLNNGLRQVKKLESIDIAMSSIQLINKFNEYQPIIINPDETQKQSSKSK
jgi:hypothetical protein